MRIKLHSIFVADQDKAKTFYTEVLSFELKQDAAYGPDTRWLTVVSPEDPNGIELLLAPTKGDAAAEAFQKAQYAAEKPASSFTTDDIQKEYERLQAQGVVFRMEPKQMPYGGTDAVFEDGCGNLLNLHQD